MRTSIFFSAVTAVALSLGALIAPSAAVTTTASAGRRDRNPLFGRVDQEVF